MSSTQVADYAKQLAAIQEQILAELTNLDRAALRYETKSPRWNTVRRVMLRFGDHLREHTTQLAAARESLGATQTMPQRMLARAQEAYGALSGALLGLSDRDLDGTPEVGEWTPRQILEHMLAVQRSYLEMIRQALQEQKDVAQD